MRKIFNAVFLLLAAGLAFLLYKSIEEPIAFDRDRVVYEEAVKKRLIEIREAQEMYQDMEGEYADNFDTLTYKLRNGQFSRIKVIGDPDDPNFVGQIVYDTTFSPAIDSVEAMGIILDSLEVVPYGNGATFDIAAKVIPYENTEVAVVQVGTQFKTFMGIYADPRFKRYDNFYDPNEHIRFGDLTKPSLAGTWD
ncbi:MAG: hypothetical protein AAF433_09435 [Bacteroidota bacterium]